MPAWADWDWLPDMTPERLSALRELVRASFQKYVRWVLERGEQLVRMTDSEIETPLGFTPNSLVKTTVEQAGQPTDFFTLRFFFHAVQLAGGDYEAGPQRPFRTLPNVLLPPHKGW